MIFFQDHLIKTQISMFFLKISSYKKFLNQYVRRMKSFKIKLINFLKRQKSPARKAFLLPSLPVYVIMGPMLYNLKFAHLF